MSQKCSLNILQKAVILFSGGSDDGASCAIMLEILQIITQMNQPLKHNLILLFNGAEENLMQVIYDSLYCMW
jgi:putative aminopeptidase FrvX